MNPMLAGKAPENLRDLKFPVLVSPKLDGIRARVIHGQVYSRSLKLIPCPTVQQLFGKPEYDGLDGELIVGEPTAEDCMRRTDSAVMSKKPTKETITFHVFDKVDFKPFRVRLRDSKQIEGPGIVHVPHVIVGTPEALTIEEEKYLDQGYEGLMIRDPEGPYKHGRSTTREGSLLKLKRFSDSEAVIIGLQELMHNDNEAFTNELGHTARSTSAEGKVASGKLGAFIVRDVKTGVEFNVGSGFTMEQRELFYDASFVGKEITYRFFATGSKDKPRFPTFHSFRSPE